MNIPTIPALFLHRIFYLFLLQAIATCLSGQQPVFKLIPSRYELEHLRLSNKEEMGLVNEIIEDQEGYIWMTSTKGFHVFDGQHILTYANGSKAYPLLKDPDNNVLGYIARAPDGTLWIVAENRRFIHFDPKKRVFLDSFSIGMEPDFRHFRLASNGTNGLFFTRRNGNENNISLYRKQENENVNKIFEFAFEPGVNLVYQLAGNEHWFFLNNKILRVSLDGKKVSRYTFPDETNTSFVIYTDDRSVYFIGNKQEAIYTWNPATDKIELFTTLPSLLAGRIHAFYIENNKIYAGSNLNMFIIDKSDHTIQDLSPQFTELARKEVPGSLSESLGKIFRSKNGGILLQTLSNIYRLKKKIPPVNEFRQEVEMETKRSVSDLISFRALAEDDHHTVYASYYTGISKRPVGKKGFSPLPVSRYLKGDLVSTYSLHYWKDHLLWNNVKIDLHSGTFRYLVDSTFGGHCTQLLYRDSLWLFKWGTGILHCYDLTRDKLNSYPLEIDIPVAGRAGSVIDMNDIIPDTNEQNLWIASRDFGLCLISKKGKLLKQYRHKELFTTDDYVTDLERVRNDIWFGCTDGLGVLHTATGKVTLYKNPVIDNGQLKNRAVFSIQTDSLGNFYLGSSYGLLYFDTRNTEFYNLPQGHPLSTVEFNRASSFRTAANRYYVGSTDGLFSFLPGELEFVSSSYNISPLKLTGISIFNSRNNAYRFLSGRLDSLARLVLYPFENNIQFNFSVPEFYRDVYYSYRVKDQGDNWTEYRPDNKIILTGLQPGNYLLEVKVSSGMNDDHTVYFSLPITMKQAWYKKSWVIALFSLVLISLLVLYLRSRFGQKLKRQKDLADLRTRISSDLHDDVGTILSGLAMQSQMLAYSAKENEKESLNEISAMSREAMEHMRDTVWAMDSRKDKYENLIDRMRAFAEKNLAMKNITHEFILADIDTKKFIDPEKRQAIYLIFKEAVTNIIKHSNGDHVIISFSYARNSLQLTIQDNGTLQQFNHSDGLGVSNMKMRAGKIGGLLTTSSGNGFRVDLVIN